jgi:hypothetical protein
MRSTYQCGDGEDDERAVYMWPSPLLQHDLLDHVLLEEGHGVLLDCGIHQHVEPCSLVLDQPRVYTPGRKPRYRGKDHHARKT